tara:strand:+ start:978 stop:2117 length:1140 start_codon:yes stop_codon:yes gene_type:complete
MKIHETIIIGAGISGLACAHTLSQANKKFKIISENIGGRIVESSEDHVEYGAFYVMKGYSHILPFIKLGRRIELGKFKFHKGHNTYKLFTPRSLPYIPQLVRSLLLLKKFKKHYRKFKKNSMFMSQVEALQSDPFLFKLYKQKATQLIKEYNIKEITYDYYAECLHGTTFTDIKNINAFSFLHFTLPTIVPCYEFIFEKNKMTNKFKKNIIKESVKSLTKKNKLHCIKTKTKSYLAKNIVVATPPHISQKLLKMKKCRGPVSAHMFHIKGTIKKEWDYCEENFFADNNRMLAIAHQPNDTYLFYSRGKNPKFDEYFTKYKIIKHKFWNPAFNIEGNVLWDSNHAKNLYLIGDHNVCGLEDSFITGVYAANQIIKKNSKL